MTEQLLGIPEGEIRRLGRVDRSIFVLDRRNAIKLDWSFAKPKQAPAEKAEDLAATEPLRVDLSEAAPHELPPIDVRFSAETQAPTTGVRS